MSAVLVVLLVLYVLLLPEMKVLCFISKGKNCHSIHHPETKLSIFDFKKYQTKEEVSQRTPSPPLPSNHSQFSVGAILSIIPKLLYSKQISISCFSCVWTLPMQSFRCPFFFFSSRLDGLKCLHPHMYANQNPYLLVLFYCQMLCYRVYCKMLILCCWVVIFCANKLYILGIKVSFSLKEEQHFMKWDKRLHTLYQNSCCYGMTVTHAFI